MTDPDARPGGSPPEPGTPPHSGTLVEACVTSLEEAEAAFRAGAHRLELCRELEVGGLTPAASMVRAVRARVPLPLLAMVRPRPGSFQVSPEELETMIDQAGEVLAAGADGIVVGVLSRDGSVDAPALKALVTASAGAPVTFHRAFDEIPDQLGALSELASAGVARVLTAGGPGTAWQGRDRLRALVRASGGRMTILGAGSIRGDHVMRLVSETGLTEVHARAAGVPGLCGALSRTHPVTHRPAPRSGSPR